MRRCWGVHLRSVFGRLLRRYFGLRDAHSGRHASGDMSAEKGQC